MSNKEFEDRRWKNQDQKIVFRHQAAASMIDGGRVLDLGCGDGFFLQLLHERNIVGHGLDMSSDGIEKCQSKGLNAEVYDFANMPLLFADNTFDYVVMLDVLEHLYYPERVLAEAARVSKKFVIVGVPNFSALPSRIQVLLGGVPENNKPHKGHIFWFNLGNLSRILLDAKLAIVEVKTNTFGSHRMVIGHLTKILSKIAPSVFALSFVVKAEKK